MIWSSLPSINSSLSIMVSTYPLVLKTCRSSWFTSLILPVISDDLTFEIVYSLAYCYDKRRVVRRYASLILFMMNFLVMRRFHVPGSYRWSPDVDPDCPWRWWRFAACWMYQVDDPGWSVQWGGYFTNDVRWEILSESCWGYPQWDRTPVPTLPPECEQWWSTLVPVPIPLWRLARRQQLPPTRSWRWCLPIKPPHQPPLHP